ncbi:MAG: iron-sulfur cluster assembly scaffold protein [Terriglobales bacterium]
MYSEQVLDHFQNPRGAGDLENATVSAEVQNPACGDVMRLSLRIESGRVVEARFKAKGCVPAIACGSKLVETVTGLELAQASEIRREQLVAELGGLPEASQHAGYLAFDALQAALRKMDSDCSTQRTQKDRERTE